MGSIQVASATLCAMPFRERLAEGGLGAGVEPSSGEQSRSVDPAFASQESIDAAAAILERAMDGDRAAIDPAAEQFARLLVRYPTDPMVLVYAGASTALRADATWLPWRKLRFAEDGLAQIDAALALLAPSHDVPRADGTPVALEVRFIAASTFLDLPGLFGRRARGESMLRDVLSSPQLAQAPLSLRGAIWLRAGLQASEDQRSAQAREWLQLVIDARAPQAAAARARLADPRL